MVSPPYRAPKDPWRHSFQYVRRAVVQAGGCAVTAAWAVTILSLPGRGAGELHRAQLKLTGRRRGRVPLGAGPGRGVGPRGRCGRAEVAQPAASTTCAQRGMKTRTRGSERPQVSGRGHWRAASTRGTRDEVTPQGAWGAERGPAPSPALGHMPGPRAILEHAGTGARWSLALSAGASLCGPRTTSNSRCLETFRAPRGWEGVNRNQAREENPHQDVSSAFRAATVGKGCSQYADPLSVTPPEKSLLL